MPEPSLEDRVLALEVSNRRLIGAVLGLAAILFVIFTLALAARAEADACEHATSLQVRSLAFVDDAGEPVVLLTTQDTGRLTLTDANGTELGVVVVDKDMVRSVRSGI